MRACKGGIAVGGLLLGGFLGLVGCGGEEKAAADYNDADVTFAQMMIPHHEQALEMAELADGRASDAAVKDIAERIERAQEPEIRTMKGWLEDWDQPVSGHGAGHGGGHGMMSGSDMAGLKGLKGTAFDKAFAELMIEHHNGAIAMAEEEKEKGENADAKRLAEAVVKGQSGEVEELKGIVERL
ncbi:DUF305 domain-containing protein [Streptomyces sp. GXMU-J15]|uniref:DUF305 domain-containing protein n=1 Tax=Streptomyces fuscus TaxID=3048495 RepID=A0ABT7J427_9ACTN|nr:MULTISPECIES: DUF305 domain-containing protein [Streptomyces]MDL2078328.1 DUF305 domain-containing protein [Streptomyces fuscus]